MTIDSDLEKSVAILPFRNLSGNPIRNISAMVCEEILNSWLQLKI